MPRTSSLILAAALLGGPAGAVDFPKLRPGLWESRVTHAGQPNRPASVVKMCLDAATQREMISMGEGVAKSMCRRNGPRLEGGRYVTDADCDLGGSRLRSHSVATFSGDSGYRIEVRGTFDPPMAGMKETNTLVEARHAGTCPATMKPGDIQMPNGQTMNMRQMMPPPAR